MTEVDLLLEDMMMGAGAHFDFHQVIRLGSNIALVAPKEMSALHHESRVQVSNTSRSIFIIIMVRGPA